MTTTAPDQTTASDPVLLQRLRAHFRTDPAALPVIEQEFAAYERANLHLALEELLAQPGRQAELVGVLTLEMYRAAGLARLSRAGSARNFDQGPVEYADVPLPGDRHLGCVK